MKEVVDMKFDEYLSSTIDDMTDDIMNLLGISKDESKDIVNRYIEFFKEKITDKENYEFVKEYVDKAEIFDSGDWRNDLVQIESKWHINESSYVIILSSLKPDFIDVLSILSGFITDFKTTAAQELVFSLCKIIKKLRPREYCVYIHAEETDHRKRENHEDFFVNYHEYIPKCINNECDNKPYKWKCPFEIENCCRIDEAKVFEIVKVLVEKNILSPGYDGTFKLNRW